MTTTDRTPIRARFASQTLDLFTAPDSTLLFYADGTQVMGQYRVGSARTLRTAPVLLNHNGDRTQVNETPALGGRAPWHLSDILSAEASAQFVAARDARSADAARATKARTDAQRAEAVRMWPVGTKVTRTDAPGATGTVVRHDVYTNGAVVVIEWANNRRTRTTRRQHDPNAPTLRRA